MPPSIRVFLQALLNGPSPTHAGLSATPNLPVMAENLSAVSGRKNNGYVEGSMFDSYRLSCEARLK